MNNKYTVGRALGIMDSITGAHAWAILVDGDSVLCTFHGTKAESHCKGTCAILNLACALSCDEKFDDLLH